MNSEKKERLKIYIFYKSTNIVCSAWGPDFEIGIYFRSKNLTILLTLQGVLGFKIVYFYSTKLSAILPLQGILGFEIDFYLFYKSGP